MRARIINEVNFERGSDPKSSMLIGKAKKAKEILDDLFKGKNRRPFHLTYYIKNLDHIEIFYNDEYKNRFEGDSEINDKWILRFIEKDRFFQKEGSRNIGLDWSPEHKYDLEIWERFPIFNSDPEAMGFDEKFILDLPKHEHRRFEENKGSKEKIQIIIKAFNDYYGDKIEGFELVEKIDGKNT